MDEQFTTDMSIKEAAVAYVNEAETARIEPNNDLVSAQMPHGMGAAADTLTNAEMIEQLKENTND